MFNNLFRVLLLPGLLEGIENLVDPDSVYRVFRDGTPEKKKTIKQNMTSPARYDLTPVNLLAQ